MNRNIPDQYLSEMAIEDFQGTVKRATIDSRDAQLMHAERVAHAILDGNLLGAQRRDHARPAPRQPQHPGRDVRQARRARGALCTHPHEWEWSMKERPWVSGVCEDSLHRDCLMRGCECECHGCGYDVGDPPESCRCLLPRGHDGLHRCKHHQPSEPESS